MEARRQVRKAAVSVVINTQPANAEEPWPPVVICGPEDAECGDAAEGRTLLELVYDGIRVVGTLVEDGERKIIRVEVIESCDQPPACAETHGAPTLK
ncbi:MAG: hypothetical protein ACOZHQ_10210 [Thermodesulfobacteriota bacterium]